MNQQIFYPFSTINQPPTPLQTTYFYYSPPPLINNSLNLDTSFVQLNNQFKITIPKPMFKHPPYLMKKIDHKQQQQQQTKNYIQKLYEIKALNPIQFDTISTKGPAHKPLFEMKLTINKSLKNEKSFISNGVSKKQAKLNTSKECLVWITELDEIERIKYLNEIEIIEIKSLFLQECNESNMLTNNQQIIKNEEDKQQQQQFINDNLSNNTNLFTNFTSTTTATTATTTNKKIINTSLTNPISIFTELVPNELV
jgi:hypothetical protein